MNSKIKESTNKITIQQIRFLQENKSLLQYQFDSLFLNQLFGCKKFHSQPVLSSWIQIRKINSMMFVQIKISRTIDKVNTNIVPIQKWKKI